MNPSPKRQTVIVGLFVAISIAILIGGVLTIGDLNNTFTRKLTVSTVFDEVGGLKQGDNVWFAGVKVGTVKKLAFAGESLVNVEMAVEVEAATYLHEDTMAKISSDGLIGNTIVVLHGGTPGSDPLRDGDVLVSTKSITTEDIMVTLQENNENLLVITGRLARGEGTAGKLLAEDALYTEVMTMVGDLKVASASAKDLTGSLAVFGRDLNREGSLPHDLVTDRTTYAALTAGVDKLQHASEQAAVLMEGLATGAANPATPIGLVMHDVEAGSDLKVTLGNLSASSALLAQDLEALQHNFLLRPFFRKQERVEKREAKAEAKAEAEANR